jgi:L-seryl-tRNA(Ser) seleniumtransferase
MRALRVDKMTLCALEGTLRLYLEGKHEEIPVYKILSKTLADMKRLADDIIGRVNNDNLILNFLESEGYLGGGSTPKSSFKTLGFGVKNNRMTIQEIEKYFAMREIPIIGRVIDGYYYLDMKTIFENDIDAIVDALNMML